MPHFDRFDICEAYALLESDWNNGGWLQERPTNQRRREACSVQLGRLGFRPGACGGAWESLTENSRDIYTEAAVRFGLVEAVDCFDFSCGCVIRDAEGPVEHLCGKVAECQWCHGDKPTVAVRGATMDLSHLDVCPDCLAEVLETPGAEVV